MRSREKGSERRMDAVKAHFQDESIVFDDLIAKTIPHYVEMLEALISAVPFPSGAEIDAIDLGSGTGNLSLMMRKKFRNARITCLDLSEKMLEASRNKLGGDKTSYLLVDFSTYEFDAEYDVVVSSLALHHLEARARQQFFAKVHNALRGGGAFLNADIVLAGSAPWQRVCLKKWKDFLSQSFSAGEIKEISERYRNEDRPAVLLDDLILLKESNFRKPDILWKYYNFAVYGAIK